MIDTMIFLTNLYLFDMVHASLDGKTSDRTTILALVGCYRVIVLFTVEPDGTLKNIQVETPVSPLLDEEAVRVVKRDRKSVV